MADAGPSDVGRRPGTAARHRVDRELFLSRSERLAQDRRAGGGSDCRLCLRRLAAAPLDRPADPGALSPAALDERTALRPVLRHDPSITGVAVLLGRDLRGWSLPLVETTIWAFAVLPFA